LIRDGSAIPFTAHATPPTVTMPRVKALTTGSVPSFLDLILNFAESDTSSSLATQDTWLAQLRRRGEGREDEKVVFYGDDTWLKLFPGDFFGRSEGTSSFFVSVSRHTSTCIQPVQSLAGKLLLAMLAWWRPVEHNQAKYRSFFSCRISLKSTIT
jgi:predicted AlkP superfamily pyrophosphatase or phosphodiesterase